MTSHLQSHTRYAKVNQDITQTGRYYLMYATFQKRLRLAQSHESDTPRVYFEHSLRCPIKAWFEESDQNPFGWMIQFESNDPRMLKEFKSSIFKQGVEYLERRLERKVTDINFNMILNLAKTTQIRTFDKEIGA